MSEQDEANPAGMEPVTPAAMALRMNNRRVDEMLVSLLMPIDVTDSAKVCFRARLCRTYFKHSTLQAHD